MAATSRMARSPTCRENGSTPVQYGVRKEDALIDYGEMDASPREHKPKLDLSGYIGLSARDRFARFRKIADEVGAFFMVDMAHYAACGGRA